MSDMQRVALETTLTAALRLPPRSHVLIDSIPCGSAMQKTLR